MLCGGSKAEIWTSAIVSSDICGFGFLIGEVL